MAGAIGLGAGVKALLLGGAAIAVGSVAAAVWQVRSVPGPAPDRVVASAQAPAEVALPPAPTGAEGLPAQPAPLADADRTVAVSVRQPPNFDVVRVEPDGATLVAGRAEAGQEVAVLVDGAQTAVTRVDPQGRFVVFLTLASSRSTRVMTLELRPSDGAAIASEEQVLLAPGGLPDSVAEAVPAQAEQAEQVPGAGTQGEPTASAQPAVVPPAAEFGGAVSPAVAAADTAVAGSVEPAPVAAAAPAPEPEPVAAALPDLPKADAPVAKPVTAAVAAPQPPMPEPAPVSGSQPNAGAGEAVAAAPEADIPEPADPPPQSAAMAVAPKALLLSGNRARVLQSAGSDAVAPPGTVSIDAISYTASGDVALSGRGEAMAFVRLYLDNRVLLETAIAEDGTWGGTLPAVAPGVYTLRADQVSARGQVTSRFETPFQREDPQALAAASPEGAAEPETGAEALGGRRAGPRTGRVNITVQPGFTLWQIARENYGDGMLYVRVYDANKTLIRDPDLIYPGQVFSVPTSD